MDFTPSFWLILGLTLVLGWLLGLMSRSGGGRWKRELKTERETHAAALRDRDDRLAATLKERDDQLAVANARIAELERARPAVAYRDDAVITDPRPRESSIDTLDLRSRQDSQGRP